MCVEKHILTQTLKFFNSVGLQWEVKICVLNKFLSEADASGFDLLHCSSLWSPWKTKPLLSLAQLLSTENF